MAQIHFAIKDELDEKIRQISEELGLAKSDYIKSLIIEDVKRFILKQKNEK